ncbi:MAG: sigma-70 family RNA polymerase sigma factor [Solirubrobacterales bacterium]
MDTVHANTPRRFRGPDRPHLRQLRRRKRGDDTQLVRATDEQLARLVAEDGSTAAFQVLYERHRRGLFGFCVTLLRDGGEAEDALHDSLIGAWQRLRDGHVPDRVRPWLFGGARNACIDRIRARDRGPTVAGESLIADRLRAEPSAQELVERREDVRTLLADLATLSEGQRAALALRELGGFDHAEIGQVLDTASPRVKSLISEARQALAEQAVGRELTCEVLRERMDAGGKRALRARRLQAHLAQCPRCRGMVRERLEAPALGALVPLGPSLGGEAALGAALAGGTSTSSLGGVMAFGGGKVAVVAIAGLLLGGVGVREGVKAVDGRPDRSAPTVTQASAPALRPSDPLPGGLATIPAADDTAGTNDDARDDDSAASGDPPSTSETDDGPAPASSPASARSTPRAPQHETETTVRVPILGTPVTLPAPLQLPDPDAVRERAPVGPGAGGNGKTPTPKAPSTGKAPATKPKAAPEPRIPASPKARDLPSQAVGPG